MKTLDLADSEELEMFSVFDGFGPKKGGFSLRRPSILGRFPMVRAKFPLLLLPSRIVLVVVVVLVLGRFPVVRAELPPLAFPSSFYPMSNLAIGPNP